MIDKMKKNTIWSFEKTNQSLRKKKEKTLKNTVNTKGLVFFFFFVMENKRKTDDF